MTAVPQGLSSALAGRYRVERELGRGGMATVYLAHDLRHDRPVALKVLQAELGSGVNADRFLREIRLAAGLTHPHILPVFDSGEADGLLFYVMPVMEGESLRDRLRRERQLPIDDAVRIVAEVADALDYAHRRDVIHRDIKPENILMHGGHALVADFGIGKALTAGAQDVTMTQAGTALGTPAYMSPEQAAGDHLLDGRSDLYSLGCVFWEMLVGEPLYSGPTAAAVIAKRFTAPAPDVTRSRDSVSVPVSQAIVRLLAREPADRLPSGRHLADLLRNTRGAGTAPDEQSLAVLPFANMSADPENEYFSDGMTEEIINALVQLPDLRVAARTSVFAFKGRNEDLRVVAEKLNVRTVLEGSVRKSGDRIRITAQLINAADGYHLWSERFDRKLDDIFEVQDEIARTIAAKLEVRLAGGGQAPLVRAATASTDAYELYLQGRHFWAQRGQGLLKALRCFEAALEKDPAFALAHAGVADVHTLFGFYGFAPVHTVMPRARAAAERALALDPNLAEAHNALAFIHLSYDWDVPAARGRFERALALKPTYIPARYWYASSFVASDDMETAIAVDEEAVRIEPLNLFANTHLGWMFLSSGRTGEAAARLGHALELEPNFMMAHWLLGQAYVWLGRPDEGIAEARRALELSGRLSWMVASLASMLAHVGRDHEARELLAELLRRRETEYVRSHLIAQVYSRLGDHDAAFTWLELARDERDPALVYAYLTNAASLFGMAMSEETLGLPRWAELRETFGIKR